jgi:HEAT repeat protein
LLGKFPFAAIDTAIDLLGSDDRDLRWAAAGLIKRAVEGGESSAMKRLCDAATKGNVIQRRMALYALRDLGISDRCALAAAQDALAERDVELRLAGLSAFVQLSEEPSAAADSLIGLLEDPELRVQRAAAAAFGSLGCCSKDVIQAIERALVSPDHSVRRAAQKSLERLGAT